MLIVIVVKALLLNIVSVSALPTKNTKREVVNRTVPIVNVHTRTFAFDGSHNYLVLR